MSNSTTPMLDPATIAAIEAIFKVEVDYRANQYITVASFAVLVYDALLTFPEEYAFVWKGKANMGGFIYLLIRYGYILESAASFPYFVWLNPKFGFCKVFFRVDAWASTVLSFPITCILGMRTYALYDRQPFAKWFLIVLTAIEIIALIVAQTIFSVTAKHTEEPLLIPGTTCIYTLYSLSYGVGILVFATSAAYDLIIFLMTALRCLRYFTNIPLLRSKVGSDRRPQLVTVVLRDCFFYFGILFTSDFISFILYVTIPDEHSALRNVLVNPARAISVVGVSRLLLNLRKGVTTSHITASTLNVAISELQWNPNPDLANDGDPQQENSSHTQVGGRSLVFGQTTTTMTDDIEMT